MGTIINFITETTDEATIKKAENLLVKKGISNQVVKVGENTCYLFGHYKASYDDFKVLIDINAELDLRITALSDEKHHIYLKE